MASRAWIVRIAGREDFCAQHNVVAIGWSAAMNLDESDIDWDAFRSRVREAYPAYESARALGQACGSIWRFIREIKKGDWLVVPTWTGLQLAQALESAAFKDDWVAEDCAWHIPVDWVNRDVPRSMASAPLQARCSARQTCVEAHEFVEEVERLSRDEGKVNFEVAIEQSEAVGAIGEILDAHLNPNDLEVLVANLAASGGAIIDRPPKNATNKKGDVDVIARYVYPQYSIGYQVKKHAKETTTDAYAIRQIMEAMEDPSLELDIGCVISTANDFSPEARELAENSGAGRIILMARHELIRWMLSVGVSPLRPSKT